MRVEDLLRRTERDETAPVIQLARALREAWTLKGLSIAGGRVEEVGSAAVHTQYTLIPGLQYTVRHTH